MLIMPNLEKFLYLIWLMIKILCIQDFSYRNWRFGRYWYEDVFALVEVLAVEDAQAREVFADNMANGNYFNNSSRTYLSIINSFLSTIIDVGTPTNCNAQKKAIKIISNQIKTTHTELNMFFFFIWILLVLGEIIWIWELILIIKIFSSIAQCVTIAISPWP